MKNVGNIITAGICGIILGAGVMTASNAAEAGEKMQDSNYRVPVVKQIKDTAGGIVFP